MNWDVFFSQFQDPHAPGLIILAVGLVLFIFGVARHQKRVEAKLNEIASLLKTPTQVMAVKHDQGKS